MLVVLDMSLVEEVKIHTERTDSGHLLRDGQRTTVCNMVAVETIEIVHLLLGNRIQNSMSEELMSFETAFGLSTVSV